ncbi:DMT family transporter [Novosphingobium mangrovi (ex Huang et al. 2023)]|uniref:DMT family transporter n=1 Tax=Novosphingobium mangrovi (ex Huang et al. 2023) TaxID=2976432 RepID=A0ABT2I522_9SPHN|nr:DMT family transporter [Novosphingobium mangrovi (ex Huang et al. 2023)]MCT2399904.1 DMT family transporter [Novosphingobium mangrovi (ex Huang et al. 2023)]
MLSALAIVWGGSFFFNGVAVRQLPVFTVVACRVGLAAIILLAVLRLRGERMPRDRHVWSAFFGMGLLNNAIPFSLIVWGQQYIASGVASILNASTPLFTVVLAHLLTGDERMTEGKLSGVLIGFIGVAVMIGADAFRDLGMGVTAQFMCLAGAVSYAFAGIYGRRFRAMGVSPMSAATGQVVTSSLILLPFVIVLDRPWMLQAPGLTAIGALIGLAAISTALAYALYFRILATAGATNLLLVTFLIPVSAILLGTLFLGEVLLPRHFAGMGLIGAGLAAIDGRLWTAVASLWGGDGNS